MRLASTATATAIIATIVGLGACGSSNPASPSVFSVIITAPKQTIAVGEPVQLTTTARDANGVTIGGAKITYAATPAGVVNVNTTGRVIGLAAGNAVVTATSGGQASPPFAIQVVAGNVAAVVTMQANTFTPTQVTIRVSQSVLWDFPADQHNVMFSQPGSPTSIPTSRSVQVTRTFQNAGNFPYRCDLHPGMEGTVIVNP